MFGFLKLGQDWSESKYPYLTWRRNQTRLGYETVNQVLCRGTEQCDGEWLLKGQDLEDKEDNEKKGKKGDNHEKGNSGKDKSERQKTHQQEVKENGQKNNEETMKESSQHKDNKSKQ